MLFSMNYNFGYEAKGEQSKDEIFFLTTRSLTQKILRNYCPTKNKEELSETPHLMDSNYVFGYVSTPVQ
jgi:hypothetical protein